MRIVGLIAAKDLVLRVRDRSVVLIGVVVPFGLAAVLSLVFGGQQGVDVTFSIGVVVADTGPVGEAFVEELVPALEQSEQLDIRRFATDVDARDAVLGDDLSAAIVVPAGLSEAVAAGRSASIDVLENPDAPIGTSVAESIADGFAAQLRAPALAGTAAALTGSREAARPVAELAARVPEALVTEAGDVASAVLDATTYLSAGMAVFFLFFTVSFGVLGVLEEREQGTLARLLAAPVRPEQVIAAKALTSLVLGIVSMSVLEVGTTWLLGASFGPWLPVGVLTVAGVLAATGIVVAVAGLARSAEHAGVMQAIVAISLGFVGGTFFPIDGDNTALRLLSRISPHHWFQRGLGELAQEGTLTAVMPAVAALVGFATVGALVGLVQLSRTELAS